MIEISDFYFVLAIRLRQETIFYPPMHLAYTHRRSHCYHVTFANQICVSFSHDVPAIKLRQQTFFYPLHAPRAVAAGTALSGGGGQRVAPWLGSARTLNPIF